ncbi:MAG: type II toxin-antitoxin system VapC family toxin [Solirubrobacterales bacterium]
MSDSPETNDRTVILDASALIAWLGAESGKEVVEPLLPESLVSALNWSETLEALAEFGVDRDEARAVLPMIEVVPFSEPQAVLAAAMRPSTRSLGLSLADRACLSLAMFRECPVYTADRAWAGLDIGVDVKLIY